MGRIERKAEQIRKTDYVLIIKIDTPYTIILTFMALLFCEHLFAKADQKLTKINLKQDLWNNW